MPPHKCMLFTVISFSLPITLLNSMQEWSSLHTAAETGDNNYLKYKIINQGYSANTKTIDGSTPLHYAASHGRINTAKLLLQLGAIPDAKTNLRFTPLHYAAQNGHTSLVNLLLAYGINQSNTKRKKSPLDLAAYNGHDETVYTLLNNCALSNPKRKKLSYYICQKELSKIKYPRRKRRRNKIKKKEQTNVQTDRAIRNLVKSIKQCNFKKLCAAINNGAIVNTQIDDDENTPLHLATLLGIEHKMPSQPVETIKNMIIILLAHGADPTRKNKFHQNAIHLATQNPTILATYIRAATVTALQLWKTIRTNNKKAVETLLKYASVQQHYNLLNKTDPSGNNALHIAAINCSPSVIQLLLNYGADKTRVNHCGKTALALAQEHQSIHMYYKLYPLLYATSIPQ